MIPTALVISDYTKRDDSNMECEQYLSVHPLPISRMEYNSLLTSTHMTVCTPVASIPRKKMQC